MKQLIFILFTFCAISNTYASDECLHRPGCEELGYIQTRSQCACFNKDVLPCPFNIKDDNTVFCGDLNCQEQCNKTTSLYSGENNTKAAVATFGTKAYVPYAASQFYVGDKDGDFGQGKWYIPAMGEWMDIFGTDYSKITAAFQNSGYVGNNLKLINSTLAALSDYGLSASTLSGIYWSSSEFLQGNWAAEWTFNCTWGSRNADYVGSYTFNVRAALFLKGLYRAGSSLVPPKVGDVVYLDKTYGAVEDYDGSKTVVGVVASVSSNGRDATILNLKDLTFTAVGSSNNFNPENPYGESKKGSNYSTGYVPDIEDYSQASFLAAIQDMCGCSCGAYQCQGGNCAEYNEDCSCKRCLSFYTLLDNGVCDANCAVQCQDALLLYDGKGITKQILETLPNGIGAQAANEFYVGDKNGDFGQGKWYVPSIGEWIDIRGISKCLVTLNQKMGTYGGYNFKPIQDALTSLADQGGEASPFEGMYYSSLSVYDGANWYIDPTTGGMDIIGNTSNNPQKIRVALLLQNISKESINPQIGDVMYTDKSYGKADNYDGSKIPAGIIFAVSEDASSVKIINLKDLTFSSKNKVGNFDAENPYGNTETKTGFFSTGSGLDKAPMLPASKYVAAMNKSCRCSCEFE